MRFGFVETTPVRNSDGVTTNYFGVFLSADGNLLEGYMKALGPRPLLRELLANALARLLRLRVPDPHLVICPPQVMSVPEALPAPPTAGRVGRLLFATETAGISYARLNPQPNLDGFPTDVAMKIFTEAAEHLPILLRNWASLDTAILFDEWIANDDRNLGNFLLTDDDDICLIDHERAFGGQEANFDDLAPELPSINSFLQWGYGEIGTEANRRRLADAVHDSAALVPRDHVEAAVAKAWKAAAEIMDAGRSADAIHFLLERWPLMDNLLLEKLPLPAAAGVVPSQNGEGVHG